MQPFVVFECHFWRRIQIGHVGLVKVLGHGQHLIHQGASAKVVAVLAAAEPGQDMSRCTLGTVSASDSTHTITLSSHLKMKKRKEKNKQHIHGHSTQLHPPIKRQITEFRKRFGSKSYKRKENRFQSTAFSVIFICFEIRT